MISEDSELCRAHPDWVLAVPGQAPVRSRSQLVLDFSREEVREHIFRAICAVLDSANIEYLKWDLNRSIADVYSHAAPDQGRVLYQNMLGVYEVLEKLCARYPDLLIEGCSGGGGRFDAGMPARHVVRLSRRFGRLARVDLPEPPDRADDAL